jgi:hypothetical protein
MMMSGERVNEPALLRGLCATQKQGRYYLLAKEPSSEESLQVLLGLRR